MQVSTGGFMPIPRAVPTFLDQCIVAAFVLALVGLINLEYLSREAGRSSYQYEEKEAKDEARKSRLFRQWYNEHTAKVIAEHNKKHPTHQIDPNAYDLLPLSVLRDLLDPCTVWDYREKDKQCDVP